MVLVVARGRFGDDPAHEVDRRLRSHAAENADDDRQQAVKEPANDGKQKDDVEDDGEEENQPV